MTRPAFKTAWAASQRIYSPANSAEKVAMVIGGDVAANIRDKKNPWANTCAVRMSYILGQSGLTIPAIPGKTKKGGDKQNYFYRVRDIIAFLKSRWGMPEKISYPLSSGALAGRKGVVLFEVEGWGDASGHASLFDGSTCYDHCYFNEPGATYRTPIANLWTLQQ